MRRRAVVAAFSATALGWLLPAGAQTRRARVGVLLVGRAAGVRDLPLAIELARLGYSDGRNVTYDILGADGDPGQLPRLARELVARKPDVIVSATSAAAEALTRVTSDIPIVMMLIGDPIAIGLTTSMARPTRNVTGFTLSQSTLAAKRLEILRELIPNLSKVAYLWAKGPMDEVFEQQVRAAAERFGITLVSLPVTTETSLAERFADLDREQVQAVLVETSPMNLQLSGHIVNECLVRDLPAMHTWYFEARDGALMAYGPAVLQDNAAVARYVARLLGGGRVAELPFEEPTQIKLTLNLRTARAIGITVPPTLIARADEVIE
jgi:putative ABC transport system substrate-binding protein